MQQARVTKVTCLELMHVIRVIIIAQRQRTSCQGYELCVPPENTPRIYNESYENRFDEI